MPDTHADRRGLAMTTASAEAAAAFDATIDQYLEYRLSTGAQLKVTLALDPDFPLARCLQGYVFMLFGSTQTYPKVRALLDDLEPRVGLAVGEADGPPVTARERLHVAALAAWHRGDLWRAGALCEQILADHPADLLALRLHHFNVFWMGRSAALRDVPAGVLAQLDESTPGYGNVLGMLAFGLEECGHYAEAEAAGRRAVELNGEDLWAVHAVAHALEMQGRLADGMAWLDQPPGTWADRNPFKDHLWWHTALFPLEAGDYDRVLALYDAKIKVDETGFYLDVQNAASMLARLEFCGVAVGDRWEALAQVAETRIGDHVLPFTDTHYMWSLVADQRLSAAESLLDSLRSFAATPDNFAASTMTPVTLPICEAILAYGQAQYHRAVELLLPLRHDFARIGASHAQRDLFAQLLIEAAVKGGELGLARGLLAERVAQRPHSRGNWLKYGQVLQDLAQPAAAEDARRRAEAVAA